MRVIICENYEEMSNEAAKIVAGQIMLKPNCTLGLATGSTPVGMYKKLCEMNKNGEIDLQILGIGENGHIGFNEPSAKLNTKTHLTLLTESTINANSRFFTSADEVPHSALTMGIATILKSKKIILMASGAAKHCAVKAMLKETVDTDVPATVLNLHNDVVLICDKAAYFSERIGVDIGGTDIKFCVLDDENKILHKETVPTNKESEQALTDQIAIECKKIMQKFSITAVGVGTPGMRKIIFRRSQNRFAVRYRLFCKMPNSIREFLMQVMCLSYIFKFITINCIPRRS